MCTYGIVFGGFQYSLKMFVFEKVRSKRFPWAWSFLRGLQAPLLVIGTPLNCLVDWSLGPGSSRYLSLGLCSTVKDTTLNKLGPGCPHLEFLNLFGCAYLSEKGIERLVTTAPALKHLDMRGILGVGQAFSLQLEKDYPNINIVHQFQPKPLSERKRRSRN